SGCPTGSGFDPAPAGMLCKVSYVDFNAGESDFLYLAGHLARIVDPGGATTDFAYDASGRLIQHRDFLTNDLAAAGTFAQPTAATHLTEIAYDPTTGSATSVTQPEPSAAAARPRHVYTYPSQSPKTTRVQVDGANPTGDYTRQV